MGESSATRAANTTVRRSDSARTTIRANERAASAGKAGDGVLEEQDARAGRERRGDHGAPPSRRTDATELVLRERRELQALERVGGERARRPGRVPCEPRAPRHVLLNGPARRQGRIERRASGHARPDRVEGVLIGHAELSASDRARARSSLVERASSAQDEDAVSRGREREPIDGGGATDVHTQRRRREEGLHRVMIDE